MSRAVLGLLATVVLLSASLAGCGDDESSSPTAAADATSSSSSGTINRAGAPTVSGVPGTTAIAGQAYSFQPQVSNTGATAVSFTIAHTPAWAKFDPTTGMLSGTPSASQVGQYAGIAITLVAGQTSVSLPAFTITVATNAVASTAPSAVTLSWDPPTENADGTPLVDLKGYTVHYGEASKTYSDSIQLTNPGLTTYVVQNLAAGKYYFAVSAYNSKGEESALSPEVATQVD
jgi:hypothetical protein